MRKEKEIFIFEQDEELKEKGENFQGYLVSQIPGEGEIRGLVTEILQGKVKTIGIIDLPGEKIDQIRGRVITLLLERDIYTLEDNVPDIAIDTNLGYWYID